MLKLVSNKIRCKFCGDILYSFAAHDFKRCMCGKCSIDGGLEYAQRSFVTEKPEDTYEDLSVYVDENGKLVDARNADVKDIPLKPIRVEIEEVEVPDEPKTPHDILEEITEKTSEEMKAEADTIINSPDVPELIEEQSDEPIKPIINMPKWGKSKYVTEDGKLTEEGKKRYFETEK